MFDVTPLKSLIVLVSWWQPSLPVISSREPVNAIATIRPAAAQVQEIIPPRRFICSVVMSCVRGSCHQSTQICRVRPCPGCVSNQLRTLISRTHPKLVHLPEKLNLPHSVHRCAKYLFQ
ncbi:hypothetical protein IG631_15893 [Alternaria alternata]|nr:hypothetical protein IG631_15893 [Alternaria alternata]